MRLMMMICKRTKGGADLINKLKSKVTQSRCTLLICIINAETLFDGPKT